MKHLLCLGFGYSARVLARQLEPRQWRVSGTSRAEQSAAEIQRLGFMGCTFDSLVELPTDVTHVLVSIPPDATGEPSLNPLSDSFLQRKRQLHWVGYLSSTGVYGDRQGAWTDETAPLVPSSESGKRRVAAEQQWAALGLPLHIFRLAGIYGPARNVFQGLSNGTAKRVIKKGQVFNRIHVADVATVLRLSMENPQSNAVFNVADDEPAPPQEVLAYAARLLKLPLPPEIPFAESQLSPMAKSFYSENKRISNARVKEALHLELQYPNYRVGLEALLTGV
jgi:hypothetical protein